MKTVRLGFLAVVFVLVGFEAAMACWGARKTLYTAVNDLKILDELSAPKNTRPSAHARMFAHSPSDGSLKLIRQNPHGWFTLQLPSDMRRLAGPVDVDGGRYESEVLEVNFDYWTHRNTPNWLQGNDATPLLLACSKTDGHTRTERTWIDGQRAVVQQCSATDERKGFRYLYYVTFPKVKVFDGEKFRYGMFNFTVEYKLPRYLSIARRISRSLDFER